MKLSMTNKKALLISGIVLGVLCVIIGSYILIKGGDSASIDFDGTEASRIGTAADNTSEVESEGNNQTSASSTVVPTQISGSEGTPAALHVSAQINGTAVNIVTHGAQGIHVETGTGNALMAESDSTVHAIATSEPDQHAHNQVAVQIQDSESQIRVDVAPQQPPPSSVWTKIKEWESHINKDTDLKDIKTGNNFTKSDVKGKKTQEC